MSFLRMTQRGNEARIQELLDLELTDLEIIAIFAKYGINISKISIDYVRFERQEMDRKALPKRAVSEYADKQNAIHAIMTA